MKTQTVAVAGPTGDLGLRIVTALVARGAHVIALVRHDVTEEKKNELKRLGAVPVAANPNDVDALREACSGAQCVVSALNGLSEVILDRQSRLLEAAVLAKVPRFISSDFCLDYTKTLPGDNRNLDLRRQFMEGSKTATIQMTSIFNGAFMDMLGAEMPTIQPAIRRVLYWGSADQKLDFTSKDNVAAFTAAVALDASAPRILRIAGDSVSTAELATTLTKISGTRYRTQWAGNLGFLSLMIKLTKRFVPGETEVFPPWQGMQYMRDMLNGRGKLQGLDVDRYPDLKWTRVEHRLSEVVAASQAHA